VIETAQGAMIAAVGGDGAPNGERTDTKEQRAARVEAGQHLADQLGDIKRWAIKERAVLAVEIDHLNRQVADQVAGPLIEAVIDEFADHADIAVWLAEMRADVIENVELFRTPAEDATETPEPPERR